MGAVDPHALVRDLYRICKDRLVGGACSLHGGDFYGYARYSAELTPWNAQKAEENPLQLELRLDAGS